MGNNNSGDKVSDGKSNSILHDKDVQFCMTKHTIGLDGTRGATGDIATLNCIVDRKLNKVTENLTGISAGDTCNHNSYPTGTGHQINSTTTVVQTPQDDKYFHNGQWYYLSTGTTVSSHDYRQHRSGDIR